MKTVVVSDLHLGAGHGADLVRMPFFRDLLLAELAGADQVVLLGDIVELRDSPLQSALAAAAPFFERLGEAAAGARVVFVPGNHDHHLATTWLDRRRLHGARATGDVPALGLEHTAKVTSGPLAALARAAARAGAAEVVLAYPGLWLAGGVYATHGHYLDSHLSVPTFERLGVGAVQRLIGGPPAGQHEPADYERVQAPLYAFLYELAQAGETGGRLGGRNPSARVWAAVGGGGGPIARVRGLLLGSVALPGAVRVANRLGLGRFRADLSLGEVSRAGIEAMGEVVERLGIGAEHVVFGHTHRRGPLPADGTWRAGRARLHNTGSWVWSPLLAGDAPSESPFWPGTIAVLEEGRPPELRHLLDDLDREEMEARVEGAGA